VRQLTPRRTITRGLVLGAAVWAATVASVSLVARQTPASSPSPVEKTTVWIGVFSEAQAYRGEKVADTFCIGCHGAGLTGGDSGPKLVGEKFLADWDGKSVADLVDWIFEEMPEDAPGTLKKEDVRSVVAYILQQNQMPTGKRELTADRDALAAITILSVKP
jgi:mono/diheme cytochrome c family protein